MKAYKLTITDEVRAALDGGGPVVALESINLCDGLAADDAVELALALEREVRAAGAVPATIAVVDGRARIGLDAETMAAMIGGGNARKATARDLPVLAATGGTGATTVGSTCFLAHLAGIRVVSSEAIGGVHRGFERSLDISADLVQVSRRPCAVVASGIKSFLEVGATLELLETLGVAVLGLGTRTLPGFYARTSRFRLDDALEDEAQVAEVLCMRDALGSDAGVVVCRPVPPEAAIPEADVAAWTESALEHAEREGVTGKAVTPFVLDRLRELSGGRTERAAVALGRANAASAARLAQALCRTDGR